MYVCMSVYVFQGDKEEYLLIWVNGVMTLMMRHSTEETPRIGLRVCCISNQLSILTMFLTAGSNCFIESAPCTRDLDQLFI